MQDMECTREYCGICSEGTAVGLRSAETLPTGLGLTKGKLAMRDGLVAARIRPAASGYACIVVD